MYRSHPVSDLFTSPPGTPVTIAGWVQTVRDHGGLLFIELRDRSGRIQCVVDAKDNLPLEEAAKTLRDEWVVSLHGTVGMRPEGTVNTAVAGGDREVRVSHLTILNSAKTPPFPVGTSDEVSESLRLTYRYLDRLSPRLLEALRFRSELTTLILTHMTAHQFW